MNAAPSIEACRSLAGLLRAHECAAMALLLDRSLPDVDATAKALDVIWRDLANIAAGRGMLADSYRRLNHPRWAAREQRRYDALESLAEIACGILQNDASRATDGASRLNRATAKRKARR